MDESQRQITAKALLGQGMAAQAADTQKLRQRYDKQNVEAQMNGQTFPSFEEWAKEFTQAAK